MANCKADGLRVGSESRNLYKGGRVDRQDSMDRRAFAGNQVDKVTSEVTSDTRLSEKRTTVLIPVQQCCIQQCCA